MPPFTAPLINYISEETTFPKKPCVLQGFEGIWIALAWPDVAAASWLLGTDTGDVGDWSKCSYSCHW